MYVRMKKTGKSGFFRNMKLREGAFAFAVSMN